MDLRKDILPLALFVGVIVGAGVLGLPKSLMEAGLLPGLTLYGIGFLALYLGALMLAEMALGLAEKKHVPDLIAQYFPVPILGKAMAFVFLFTVMYAALTGYLLGSGAQLNALLGLDQHLGSLIFFILASLPVVVGLTFTAEVSVAVGLVMLLALLLIVVISFTAFSPGNIPLMPTDMAAVSAFFSVSLFALFGHNVVPEVTWLCDKKEDRIKEVLLVGLLIPLVAYVLFSVAVAGALGSQVTEVGTVGLTERFGSWLGLVISLFALAALYTSFIAIAISLRDSYTYDFGLPKEVALLLALLPPILLYYFDAERSFLGWIGDIGGRMLNLFMALVGLTYLWAVMQKRVAQDLVPFPVVSSIFVAGLYLLNFLLSLVA